MPKLFVAASSDWMAYVLDGGDSGRSRMPPSRSSMETEYIAVMYALNEYFLRWNKELDSRQDDLDRETGEFYRVATPSQQTPRPRPQPVQVCTSSELIARQLRRELNTGSATLRKLAQQILRMTENVAVEYTWVPRRQNPASKLLP